MKIKRIAISLLIVSLACFYFSGMVQDPVTAQSETLRIDGFDDSSSIAQRRLEQQFLEIPSRESAREHLRRLTAEPHVAGTKEDYETALYVRDEIRKYGLAAELKEFDVLLPYPLRPTVVELLAPRRQRLALKEDVLTEDPSSAHARIIPLFNGYSASGDVTGQVVYVNYGLPGDY